MECMRCRSKLKALCHDKKPNCFLMSSVVQNSIKVGTGSVVTVARYLSIVHGSTWRSNTCCTKIFTIVKLWSRLSSLMDSRTVRMMMSRGLRAYTMSGNVNNQQSEPQICTYSWVYQPTAMPGVHLQRGRMHLQIAGNQLTRDVIGLPYDHPHFFHSQQLNFPYYSC